MNQVTLLGNLTRDPELKNLRIQMFLTHSLP